MRMPEFNPIESQQSSVKKPSTLKSSDLGATGRQKACNCTKEHVDPSCGGKCVGQWAKNTSRVAQKGPKIAPAMSPERRNALLSKTLSERSHYEMGQGPEIDPLKEQQFEQEHPGHRGVYM